MDGARRIIVVGDELAAGAGDPRGLGWVGRVAARTPLDPRPTFLTLAMPGETTTALALRWQQEVTPRLATPEPADGHAMVVALGRADLFAGVSLARSRLNLANILDVALSHRIACFVVGPPPVAHIASEAQAELSTAFADVATRREVPFVETYAPLAQHDQWLADLADGDGMTPGQTGYGLMAWLVLHTGWHRWLGLPDDS